MGLKITILKKIQYIITIKNIVPIHYIFRSTNKFIISLLKEIKKNAHWVNNQSRIQNSRAKDRRYIFYTILL